MSKFRGHIFECRHHTDRPQNSGIDSKLPFHYFRLLARGSSTLRRFRGIGINRASTSVRIDGLAIIGIASTVHSAAMTQWHDFCLLRMSLTREVREWRRQHQLSRNACLTRQLGDRRSCLFKGCLARMISGSCLR